MSTITSERASAVAVVRSPDWAVPLAAAATLLILLVWIFWDFFRSQVNWAFQAQADWGHTLVVPFIALYFVWVMRHKLLAQPFRTTWIGLLPVVLGLAWYFTCLLGPTTLRHHNLLGMGVGLTFGGLTLLFFGWRAMRWLWFPLAYVFIFGQTISERLMNIVTFKLQDITARGAHAVLALGVDIDRHGNTLAIYSNGVYKELNIAEACSGMRMLMAFLALAVAMAFTGFRRNWQRVLLVLLAIPTAIAVNVLRVVTLGLLSLVDSDLAAGDFHSFVGLVWLIPAFLIFLGLMWIIGKLVIEEDGLAQAAPAAGR